MIRLLLPSIMGFSTILTVIWIIYYLTIKYTIPVLDQTNEVGHATKKDIKKAFRIVTFLILIGFIFYVANIASVNEVPRSSPDKSAIEQGEKNMQQKLEDQANKPKQ